MNADLLAKKWDSHRKNCIKKGVGSLSIEEYIDKIIEAGIEPEQIGHRKGNYQLSRYTDKGDYTPLSCRFITKEENYAEQVKNGGIEAGARKKRGRTAADHPGLAAMAEKKSKSFCFVAPTGEVHKGTNLSAFCRLHGLNQGNMAEVRNGKARSCKGWVCAS